MWRVFGAREMKGFPSEARNYLEACDLWGIYPKGANLTEGEKYTSDTGELHWNVEDGIFTIDTPKTQGMVGFAEGKSITLSRTRYTPSTKFCSIVVTSLDNEDIEKSKHILVTAAAQAENSGMVWDSSRTTPINDGHPPILIEPVVFNLSLLRKAPSSAKIYALDGKGNRKKEVPLEIRDDKMVFSGGPLYGTIYYEICIE